MTDVTRVMVVEREPLFRHGLISVLSNLEQVDLVGHADSAAAGYKMADDHAPAVALVGTTLSDAPGLTYAAEMRRRFPAIAVIILAAQESDDELFSAIRAGAAAYSGRDLTETTLLELIQRSANGEYVINEQLLGKPYVAARVLDQFRNNQSMDATLSNAFMPLTERELEILRKVSDGLTNAEIGYALGISPQTVKNHVTSILRKLAVNDRTQAVVTALRRGWLTIGDEPSQEVALSGVTGTPTSRLGSAKTTE